MVVKKLILPAVLLFFCAEAFIILLYQYRADNSIDPAAVNDIAQSLADRWDSVANHDLPGLKYKLDYVVLDNNLKYLKATKPLLNIDIFSAIKNRDTIFDIKKDGKFLGKLIIYNDTADKLKAYRLFLLFIASSILFLFTVLIISFILYSDRRIFRPFRKLRNFAEHIAAGNLDIPLEMDRGNLFGAFTESFDLMREELYRARENEREANRSKKELVASLSHDIKTPVASIKAVTEVLHIKTGDENLKSQLEIINSKADQIDTLITNIFTATLEELNELKVMPLEIQSTVIYDLIGKADYNNYVKILKIADCIIIADEGRLLQVIDNIISNSYKYAGTQIDITGEIKNKYLEISFKDYGAGVPEEEKPLIFNKFYRAGNSKGKNGTGLGLYISKYLVNKMSGDIDCFNKEDGFVILLKLLIA